MSAAAPYAQSLRARLFILIVLPLAVLALSSTAVLYLVAKDMSQRLYDDTLKVVAHAVAREVVLTKGDLLTDALLDSLVGALGDPIYYQVRAADDRFVTGYWDAPALAEDLELPGGTPVFFDSVYHDRPVRAVILREFIADPDFDGWTTVQVWQTVTQREALSLTLLGQSALNLFLLVLCAAVLIWFGINRGLAPLADLRAALALRSASDLRPLGDRVPSEVAPIVATVNTLFARLEAELERRNAFIGNAAHQLRNPVAAIQAQAEAALSASDEPGRVARLKDLAETARRLSRMSRQLLHFDMASDGQGRLSRAPNDLGRLVAEVARRHVPRALKAGVEMELDAEDSPLPVAGNPVLLEEAIDNLIDNALKYGCANGGRLLLGVTREGDRAVLTVADDGPGIPPEAGERVFDRFVRLAEDDPDDGCGLGLSIVRAIALSLEGEVGIVPTGKGCTMRLALPVAVTGAEDGQVHPLAAE